MRSLGVSLIALVLASSALGSIVNLTQERSFTTLAVARLEPISQMPKRVA